MFQFLIITFFFSFAFSSESLTSESPVVKAVVIISLDGVGYEQLKKIDPQFLRNASVCSTIPPKQSMTFPGHRTIATGKKSESEDIQKIDCPKEMTQHVCNNHGNKLLVKPMWTKAAEMGFDVHTYLWPQSSTAWHGIHHHKDQNYEPDNLPLENKSPEVFSIAIQKLKSWDQKNNLFFMGYSYGLDKVGHATGPFSQETNDRWVELKSEIAAFKKAVDDFRNKEKKDIKVIFVSDHGMIETTRSGRTRGEHGLDPSFEPGMNGVYWSEPQDDSACPSGMENIADKVWNNFNLKWSVETIKKPNRPQNPKATNLEEIRR